MAGWDQNGSWGDWLRGEWIQLAQDKGRWRDVVNEVMNIQILAPRRQSLSIRSVNLNVLYTLKYVQLRRGYLISLRFTVLGAEKC
jgi:hypothetical protein